MRPRLPTVLFHRRFQELLLFLEELFAQAHVVEVGVLKALVFRAETGEVLQGFFLDLLQAGQGIDELAAQKDGNENFFAPETAPGRSCSRGAG